MNFRTDIKRFYLCALCLWFAIGGLLRAQEPLSPQERADGTNIPLSTGREWSLLNRGAIRVDGYSLLKNYALERILATLRSGEDRSVFDPSYIEDSAWILIGKVREDGYLEPGLEVSLYRDRQAVFTTKWDRGFQPPLPDPIEADRIQFTITPGTLFYFDTIAIEGITSIEEDDLLNYFYPTGFLFISEKDRYYTPARLEGGIANVLRTLRQSGYQNASLSDQQVHIDPQSGAVNVALHFDPGPLFYLEGVTLDPTADELPLEETVRELAATVPAEVYTQDWELDFLRSVRRIYYAAGYPDVTARVTPLDEHRTARGIGVHLALIINPGPQITTGQVLFHGMDAVSPALLHEQIPLKSGALLDIDQARKGRDNLASLGIFDTTRVQYDRDDDSAWDVTYSGTLKPSIMVSPIVGFGTFDVVRAGVEIEQYNIWGRAHRSRLRALQSFKTTQASYLYNVPQIFGEHTAAYASLHYLEREEISFVRKEHGGSIGTEYQFPENQINLAMQYNYQQLYAREASFNPSAGLQQATVSSLEWIVSLNRLDNPIYPTKGYQLYSSFELALPHLGGNVEYQRFLFGIAWHRPLTRSLIFHSSFRHGFITSFGPVSDNLPFNKRFFSGGENTVRGYKRGQASPKDSQGNSIGAETYMLLNLELEQKLSSLFSFVLFIDAIGFAQDIAHYPFNRGLVSAGGGFSLNTVVGPIRLEYGHNLNPRPGDPSGTIQIAIGFPF